MQEGDHCHKKLAMNSLTPSLIVTCLLCLMSIVWPPALATASSDNDQPYIPGGQIVYVPPRAYLLCWKSSCDPRLWAEMVKRTPYYNFGLGKRSSDQLYYDLDDDADDFENAPDSEEGDVETGPVALEKRARYGFGIGKREEESQRFNFGLGKREDNHRFGFGLGKREPKPFNFGLGKREGRRFGFGLGKREVDSSLLEEASLEDEANHDRYAEMDEDPMEANDKRSPMYGFGLGKREKMTYNFGLGKREKMYGFGLGKRNKMYGFGLGKRGKQYGFGLGKRVDEPEAMGYESEELKRAGPYSFGLGKRSGLTTTYLQRLRANGANNDENDKRSKFAFGLGKRSLESPSNKGKEGTKTTVAPNYDNHQQQK